MGHDPALAPGVNLTSADRVVAVLVVPFALVFLLQFLWFISRKPAEHADAPVSYPALRRRFRWAALAVLAVGLAGSAVIYRRESARGPAQPRGLIGFDVGYGYSMPIYANQTKKAAMQAEMLGGKANVVATEFAEWVGDRWRGKALATTVAILSVVACLACLLVARILV